MSAPLCRGVIDWPKYYVVKELCESLNARGCALNVDLSLDVVLRGTRKVVSGVGAHADCLKKPTTKHQE